MALTSLGSVSKTTFLIVEHAKLGLELTAAAVLKKAQPVKLNAVGDLVAWAPADGRYKLIGYCYTDAAIGDLVTIVTRGMAEIYALSSVATDAGPCSWVSYDAATVPASGEAAGYNKIGPATADADAIGWNLVQCAAANLLTRVLLQG